MVTKRVRDRRSESTRPAIDRRRRAKRPSSAPRDTSDIVEFDGRNDDRRQLSFRALPSLRATHERPKVYEDDGHVRSHARRTRRGVWWLDLGSVNAYLIDDPRPEADAAVGSTRNGNGSEDEDEHGPGLTLTDAGTPRDAGMIAAAVAETGFRLSEIECVLIPTTIAITSAGSRDSVGSVLRYSSGRPTPPAPREATELAQLEGCVTARDRAIRRQSRSADRTARRQSSRRRIQDLSHPRPHARPRSLRQRSPIGGISRRSGVRTRWSAATIAMNHQLRPDGGLVERSLALRPAPGVEIVGVGHGEPFVRDGSDRLRECVRHIERG